MPAECARAFTHIDPTSAIRPGRIAGERAAARGAGDRLEEGPMYGRGFYDRDGHRWEVMYMDPGAVEQ